MPFSKQCYIINQKLSEINQLIEYKKKGKSDETLNLFFGHS